MFRLFFALVLGVVLCCGDAYGGGYPAADSIAVEALVDSARKHLNKAPDKAMDFARAAEELSSSSGYMLGKMRSWNQMGDIYMEAGASEQALEYYQRCMLLADTLGRDHAFAALEDKAGSAHRRLGNYPEAIACHEHAKLIFDTLNNIEGVAVCLNNLAVINKFMKNFEKAKALYRESTQKARDAGVSATASQLNLSMLFLEEEELDSAEYYAQEVLDIARASNFRYREAQAISFMGSILMERGDIRGGLGLFKESRAIAEDLNNRFLLAGLLVKEGGAHRKLGELGEAKKLLLEAIDFSLEVQTPEIEKSALNVLHLVAVEEGNYKAALEYFKSSTVLQDSLIGVKARSQVALIQEEYKLVRKERELARVTLKLEQEAVERQASELDLARSRSRIWLLVAVAALLGLGVVFVLGRYVDGRRRNRLLKERQELTARSLKEKEVLLGEVHHRVKNNLQVIYNMLDMQSRGLEDVDVKAALAESMNRISAMALIHQELYRDGNLEGVQMKGYLGRLVNHIQKSFGGAEGRVEMVMEVEDLLLELESSIPMGMLINELVTNSFKHAFPGNREGEIRLEFRETGGSLQLVISDNGIGRAKDGKRNFGDRLVKSLARQIRAEVQEYTENGTKTTLTIQKYKRLDHG